ncbi:sortase [Dactylosporangium sucinum]|nr:sortase [Dactylosporangium sucinum]
MEIRRDVDRTSRLLLAAAVLLVLSGLVVGGSAAWQWWSRIRQVHSAQERLAGVLDERWASGATPPPVPRAPAALPFGGDGAGRGRHAPPVPLARLHLPTLGRSLVVVDGAGEADLLEGPGYIPGTAPIGAAGNTGIAGHRYPGVFWDLDRLRIGAPVVLETRETWLVYRVMDASIVRPDQNEVLGPPPGGAAPVLTLVTCEPKLSTEQRLIRQATLVRRDPHDGPRPAELATG